MIQYSNQSETCKTTPKNRQQIISINY